MVAERRPPTRDDLISVEQAAREYRISRSALFDRLRVGALRRWNVQGDRRTLLDIRELDELFMPREVPALVPPPVRLRRARAAEEAARQLKLADRRER